MLMRILMRGTSRVWRSGGSVVGSWLGTLVGWLAGGIFGEPEERGMVVSFARHTSAGGAVSGDCVSLIGL